MFSFVKNKLRVIELEKEVSELNDKLKNASVQLDAFKKTLDRINADVPASSFMFDFDRIQVFSIERNFNDNRPVTIIGYLLPEPVTTEENGVIIKDVVREWYLYCNQEQHEKLIVEFNNRKGIK